MRIVFVIVIVLANHADAQDIDVSAPTHAFGFFGGVLVDDVHVDTERGALVGAVFEGRFLWRGRIGVGVVPLSFSLGDLDTKRGRIRRHGGGPRVQLLPTNSRFDLTLGYDVSYVVYAVGVERMLFWPGSVDWEEQDGFAHSLSLRAGFAVGNEATLRKPWGFLLGLLLDAGWTQDRSTWWFAAGVSFGARLQVPRPG